MARKAQQKGASGEDETTELVRKLLAVTLYQAGANRADIGRATKKAKSWVVETLQGLPDRRDK